MIYIPSGAIVPIYFVSFIALGYQYHRIDPDRRIFNLRFGMMFGAVVLILAEVAAPQWSLVWFLLALFWFGWTMVLLRRVLQRP